MGDDSSASESLQRTAAILSLIYALVSLLWLMWVLIPEHRRRLMMMRAVSVIKDRAATAAFRTGHQAMALELKGCGENGSGYTMPYLLSLAREHAAKVYERLRYS